MMVVLSRSCVGALRCVRVYVCGVERERESEQSSSRVVVRRPPTPRLFPFWLQRWRPARHKGAAAASAGNRKKGGALTSPPPPLPPPTTTTITTLLLYSSTTPDPSRTRSSKTNTCLPSLSFVVVCRHL